MRRNWKYGLMCVVAGLCCFATVADVDAGIIFRRRGTGYATTQTTTYSSAPRRGVLGRRRGTVVTTTQATTTTAPPVTAPVIRGQTPEATPALQPATAR